MAENILDKLVATIDCKQGAVRNVRFNSEFYLI